MTYVDKIWGAKTTELLDEQQKMEDTQHGKYLMFALDGEDYGIQIRYVTEIIGVQPIIVLPEVPDHIKGIINLRGKIIPVMDIRLKFKKEPVPYTDRTCIIVIDTGDIVAGLIVDTVAEVLNIGDENIMPPPAIGASLSNKYMQGIGKANDRIILLLNCKRLLLDDEFGFTNIE